MDTIDFKLILLCYIKHVVKRGVLISKNLRTQVFLTDPMKVFDKSPTITVLGYPVLKKKIASGYIYAYIIPELSGVAIPKAFYESNITDTLFGTDLFGSVYIKY